MEAFLEQLIRLLLSVGPWIVFATTFFETALFVGLLVPAEAVVLVAAALAGTDRLSLPWVATATFFGALLGDQVGFLLGRYGGNRVIARGGHIARLWHFYEPIAVSLFRRRAAVGVSLARFISFVRTLMPWFAGMTGMPYGRFLLYDLLGVLGWTIGSIAVGYVAGESWRVAAEALGTVSAYVVSALLLLAVLFAARTRLSKRRRLRVLRVALTGNIASGKSAVAEVWQELGAPLVDADVLARRAVEPGTQGFEQVVRAFGAGILKDGEIDRAALRDVVFDDPAKRTQLEAIVHPEVARLRHEAEAALIARGERIIVHDIPLLFEVGLQTEFDVVVLVDAAEETRIQRIVETRGLTREAAERMVAAQMPSAEKRLPATYVIENDGTLEELKLKATEIWTELKAMVQ